MKKDKNPCWKGYVMLGHKKKNGKKVPNCVPFSEYLKEAEGEYQGRKVTLNKPFYTPDGPKKKSVYVKNDKGNVIKVNFGDPNLSIKKNEPKRKKSFMARHKCDTAKDKTSARYWSCRAWN